MTLFDHVAEWLDREAVRFAMIGAGALAVQGITAATLDQQLLVTDRRVFNPKFWKALPLPAQIEAVTAAEDDGMAGRLRIVAAGQRPVDLVVGRAGWLDGILDRRVIAAIPGRDLYVAAMADLILLKLFAWETGDASDITELLATEDTPALRQDVESRLNLLPPQCAMLWHQLLASR